MGSIHLGPSLLEPLILLLATGWGAKAWNDGEWGNLADETVSLTGISATSNIGAVGILANALVEPTGVSSTSSTGSISPVIPKTVEVGGVSFQSSVNSITNVIQRYRLHHQVLSSTAAIRCDRSCRSSNGSDRTRVYCCSRNCSCTKRRRICNRTSYNFSTRNSSRCNFT